MRLWLSLMAVIVISCSLGAISQALYSAKHDENPKLKRYCTTVYVALDMDANELADSTSKRQEAAAMRFGELVTYHSEQEIALCAKHPVDLSARGTCMLEHDYACLSKLARDASIQVKP